ncbi:class E sortase [Microbacterium awajiense]|uniref:Class E sortase n=1 Tax=Microbacterium awajiense TaxID=415214 RepID=A0ABP7APY0_9MICO
MERASGAPAAPAAARRASVTQIMSEIILTAGAVVLLFVVWYLWIGDAIIGAQRNDAGAALTGQWQAEASQDPLDPPAATEGDDASEPVVAEPVVLAEPADGETFGVLRVPRFGDDYRFEIAGGVSRARTLDPIGIGHHPGTQMPGEPGNFVIAAHRTTWGGAFHRIGELQLGDAIVVETRDGWYTYRFRTLEYVPPDRVEVLLPVPEAPGVPAGTAYITMISCSPIGSMAERIIAYGVFESFTPRAAGPPTSVAAIEAA